MMDAVVVGAGPAGLAAGYFLKRAGHDFVLLDGAERVGDSWRARWDSLELFTPVEHCSLPGFAFPGRDGSYPNKDQVADYLTAYVEAFSLPVRMATPVTRVRAAGDGRSFVVETPSQVLRSARVIVATGPFQRPHIPTWASDLNGSVRQVHSSAYRNPNGLPSGDVLVIGAGNSGVQIAAEVAGTGRRTSLAIGRRDTTLPSTLLGRSIFRWLERFGALDVPVDSRLGRRASTKDFLIGTSPRKVARHHGVLLLPRAVGARGGRPVLADGTIVEPATVVWATGYRPDYAWLHAPVFDDHGRPAHRRGLTSVPGMGFLGLPWMHTRGSALLGWVGRDAEYLVHRLAFPTSSPTSREEFAA